ncbi:DNA invertase Pin-like site-specific DNA recombinase [Micrococcus sp. UYEF12]
MSTSKQDIDPAVQIAALEDVARLNGWNLDIRREEDASAASLKTRPVLAHALADLKADRPDALAVSKLDRLSRSVADFAGMLETAAPAVGRHQPRPGNGHDDHHGRGNGSGDGHVCGD